MVRPERDLFHLGCTFYRTLTGQKPFAEDEMAHPTRKAEPVRRLCPEAPGMLADIVEELIDPDPARRPKKAGHVSKALRVYIAAEEEDLVQPEEQIAAPEKPHEAQEAEIYDVQGESVQDARIAQQETADDEDRGPTHKPLFPPRERDLVFLAVGVLAILVLLVGAHVLTGWDFANLACLMTGAAASFLVERLLLWFRPARHS